MRIGMPDPSRLLHSTPWKINKKCGFVSSPYIGKSCSSHVQELQPFHSQTLTGNKLFWPSYTKSMGFSVLYTSLVRSFSFTSSPRHWGFRIPCAWPATATRNWWRHHPAQLLWRLPTPCCPATAFAGSPPVARHRVLLRKAPQLGHVFRLGSRGSALRWFDSSSHVRFWRHHVLSRQIQFWAVNNPVLFGEASQQPGVLT